MPNATEKLEFRAMAPLWAVVVIDAISAGIILPLLPFYSTHFGATPRQIGFLVSIFSLCQFFATPLLGKLSDILGRKPVLIICQLGTCLGLVVLALANSMWLVFAARILDGITAGNLSVAGAYAVDHSTPQTRKAAFGIMGSAIGIGFVAGPALSAIFSTQSIAAPIWVAVLFSAMSIVATVILLKNEPNKPRDENAPQRLSLRKVIAAPGVGPALTVLLLFYFAFSMYVSQFALFLNGRFEWNGMPIGPREVGVAFAISGAINIVVQVVVMKRIGRVASDVQLGVLSLVLLATGFFGLGISANVDELMLAVVVASIGSSLARPTLVAILSLAAPAGHQGAMSGINGSAMAICNIFGPIVAGTMISLGWYSGWAFSLALTAAVAASAVVIFKVVLHWPPSERVLAEREG